MRSLSLILVWVALGATPLAAADTGARDPRDFPLPSGLARTSFSEDQDKQRDQEVATYHAEAAVDQVLGEFRRALAAQDWKEARGSDGGSGFSRVVITDWNKASREAEVRFYANRKGGTDIRVRVNTYPATAATAAASTPASSPPAGSPKPAAPATAADSAPASASSSPVVLLPDERGKESKDAEWHLRAVGLAVNWTAPEDEMAGPAQPPPANVKRQSPDPGTRVARGSTVTLTARRYMTRVPGVVNHTSVSATQDLKAAHLSTQMGTAVPGSGLHQADRVVSIDPAAGAVVPVNTTVTLNVEQQAMPMPNVIGKTLAEATTLMQGPSGRPLFVIAQNPPAAPTAAGQKPGTVGEQNPAPGVLTIEGSTVHLTLWGETVHAPPLVGKPLRLPAGQTTYQAGPGVHFEIRYAAPQPTTSGSQAGTVAQQDPAGGSMVINGSTITVSMWTLTGPVPDVVRMTYADARQVLLSRPPGTAKFQVQDGPPQPTTNLSQSGKIAQQTPAAGNIALDGSTVTLSKWIPLAAVPNFVGRPLGAVEGEIHDRHFVLSLAPARPCVDPALEGIVVAQSPAAHSSLAEGETVTLTVYRLHPQ